MPKKKAKKEKPASKPAPKAAAQPAIADVPSNLLLAASKMKKKQHYNTEEIIPGFMWVVHDFLTERECQNWIDFVERSKKLEYVQHPATKYIANRECFRWQQNDNAIADTLYQRMQGCGILKELEAKVDFSSDSYVAAACNPNIRLYKYERGMSFGKHVDGSHPVEGVGNTEVTVLVYLSDCQGGSTRFYPHTSGKRDKSIAFAPKLGAMLLHVHGDRCLEHEADPVEQGLKYILRTDVVYNDSGE